ncbi:MAG: glycosyltransferase family 9 protein [Vicinamibacterales bacterium]
MTPYHTLTRPVILAPNWLGDAVMALPAIADIRRAIPGARVTVAARPAVAPLFRLVSDVDDVVVLEHRGWRGLGAELTTGQFDAAVLLPNSLHAALIASRAGIPERWGYRSDWRAPLLTRAIDRPTGLHQVAYYQRLAQALGFPNGPSEPRLSVTAAAREAGAAALLAAGWDGRAPLAALAPGAAYGGAKRWPPASFASLARALAADGVASVMVGSGADAATAREVARAFAGGPRPSDGARSLPDGPRGLPDGARRLQASDGLHSLVGTTDLPTLAGVLTHCRALVTNDSGAMHLGAAIGVAVTAVFGPTDERATRPLGGAHAVITASAWCRPCMLRECPLDHQCMRGIDVNTVVAAARRTL